MPLRLSVCFRNLKGKRGVSDPSGQPLFLTTALNCESIRPVKQASI